MMRVYYSFGEIGRDCITTFLTEAFKKHPPPPILYRPLKLEEFISFVMVQEIAKILIEEDVGYGGLTGPYEELIQVILEESRDYGHSRFPSATDMPEDEVLLNQFVSYSGRSDKRSWAEQVKQTVPRYGYELAK